MLLLREKKNSLHYVFTQVLASDSHMGPFAGHWKFERNMTYVFVTVWKKILIVLAFQSILSWTFHYVLWNLLSL